LTLSAASSWERRSRAQRVGVAATLTGAISVATLAPTLLSVLAPMLTAELFLSRSAFGVLTTCVFIGGGLTSVWAGRIVDQLGGRRALFLLFTLGSVTVAGLAAAPTYAWLLVAAVAAGLPGALSNPVTNQVISVVVPSGQRGLMVGFKQSGAQIAQTAGGLVMPTMALALGWRGAALIVAVLPLAGLFATRQLLSAGESGPTVRASGRLPLRGPVASLTAYALLLSLGTAAVVTYLPLYAFEALGFSLTVAGIAASVAGVAGFAGRVLWGRAAELLISPSMALILIAAASVVSVLAFMAAPAAVWLVWPAAVAYGLTAGAWSAVGMVAVLTEIDPAYAGRASGVVLLGFYGGFIASPIVFGALADRTGSYTLGWTAVGMVFLGGMAIAANWHRHRTSRAPG
jgi:predicted MFS family arabinose efflux permease